MKQSLQIRQTQSLTLTPQLRQAIRLLQLSSVELETEISEAMESNPLLEALDDELAEGEETSSEIITEKVIENKETQTTDSEIDVIENNEDFDWSDDEPRISNGKTEEFESEFGIAVPMDLCQHLLWQLRLSHLSAKDIAIGEVIIEAINSDGYLFESPEAIQEALLPEVHADLQEINTVLQLIHHFDPVGVGAKNLSNCLLIQLQVLSEETAGLCLAKNIAKDYLEALAKLGSEKLAVQLKVTSAEIQEAVALLKSLDPKPGLQISSDAPDYVAPDCIATKQKGVWQVSHARGSQPRIGINRHYESLIGKASREDDSYLRGQLQEARWLIKSLDARADTLIRVARSIIRQQSGFLEHGPQAMRPLTLREVAEELGLHESTISRATTRKFLRTPRGTFEFRYFFSSGISNSDGGGTSATAIQSMIRKLIEAENPRHPLSDARLAELLKTEGIPVARRTVAKYREAIHIGSSSARQRPE
ncbi:MAG: RNA polymerase factor sigma-54 [Arenimonas sp.]